MPAVPGSNPLSPARRAGTAAWVGLALVLAAATPETAADPPGEWLRWRGANGQGVSAEADLPVIWSEGSPNVRWKTRIPGAGNSSPIASRGLIFLTTTYDSPEDDWDQAWYGSELHRVVVALDLESGELLWQTPIFHGPKGEVHYTNTVAAPTPVTDGRHLFVNFDGILAALDFDGNVLWQQDVDPEYMRFAHYGVSTSPILTGDAVILLQDREEGESADAGWIAAFDQATGEELWRDEWSHTCCSYTTPVLLDRGGGAVEIAMSSSKEMAGYDPRTGARLWTAPHQSVQPVPSLVTSGDLLCAPGGMHEQGLVMYRLAGRGEETAAEMLWSTGKSVPKIPTPLFYGGRLFVLTEGRLLTAFDPENGRRIWEGRAAPGKYWSSLVAGEGKLYATSKQGVVSVIAAGSMEFHLVAENAVGDEIAGATPAIAGGCFLLRTQSYLYCIEKLRQETWAAVSAS